MAKTAGLFLSVLALAGAVTISGEMTFDRDRLTLTEVQGFAETGMTAVGLPECSFTWEVGAPSLPIAVAHLVVPQGMKVTGVRLDAFETEVVEGEHEVFPVQEPRPISDPGPFEFIGPDPEYYGAFEYPARVVTPGHRGSMFGYNIASVFVAPVQYTASEKKLVFHPRVEFILELEPAELNTLPVKNRTEEARKRIEEHLANLVLNPEDLSLYAPGQ